MLRKSVSQFISQTRRSVPCPFPANTQQRFFSYGFNDDDDMDGQEDDDSYNNLLYNERKDSKPQRQTMPKAAKKNRYMAVAPENKGKLRRYLLNEFKEQQVSVGEPVIEDQVLPPDVHMLEHQLEFDEEADEMEFDKDARSTSFDLQRLGYLRQIVHMDQVQKVMPLESRLSFRAMVVVGNQRGAAGYAMGKGASVPDAIERATMTAITRFTYVDRFDNRTLYHEVDGKWNSCTLFIRPSTEGRGNVVSDVVACVLDCFGITDVVSKCHGSRNPYTVIPATFNALSKHETAEEFAMKTGHSLAEVSMLAKMRQL